MDARFDRAGCSGGVLDILGTGGIAGDRLDGDRTSSLHSGGKNALKPPIEPADAGAGCLRYRADRVGVSGLVAG